MGQATAQAKLLATQFLGGIGESKDVLKPRKTISELFLIAGELVEAAQRNLKPNVASGRGSESIILTDPRQDGTKVSVSIEMLKYLDFVNKGVKGTRSGSGKYKFKTENPSPAMLKSLSASIGRSKRKTSNVSRAAGKNEGKNLKTAQAKAWGAAVNIKRYGIKPTGFMDKAIDMTDRKITDRLGKAFEIDIFNIL